MTKTNLIPIGDYTEIDRIDRHLVIEASAGTGKTYTIEHLVVRILEEKRELPFEEILLVTFTEKAANEMRQRLRHNLEDRLEALEHSPNPDLLFLRKLQHTLHHFDQASIHTIHGFCQRILQQYAFEYKLRFDLDLVDEREIHQKVLRDLQRRRWVSTYGKNLADILILSQYPNVKDTVSEWEEKVIDVAIAWKPESGDQIQPPPDPTFQITKATEIIQQHLAVIGQLGFLPAEDLGEASFVAKFRLLNINARTKSMLIKKLLHPLSMLVATTEAGSDLLSQCTAFFASGSGSFEKLIPQKWNRGAENLSVCHDLPTLVSLLQAFNEEFQLLSHQFTANVIAELKQEVEIYKDRQGVITFNDMIRRVAEALNPKQNPSWQELLSTLQQKYQYAIVDEFQDTDPTQWQILKTIFMQENTPQRLIIIGDPKQAIYGFRGANITTYFLARETILQHGKGYTLITNWRATPALLEKLNLLFSSTYPWFGDTSPIDCPRLLPSPDKKDENNNGIHPIVLIRLEAKENEKLNVQMCRAQMAKFIASEITLLLAGSTAKEVTYPENANDICILLRGKADATLIESALQDQGIPYAYHQKKNQLYQSKEALHVLNLFTAISDPTNQELLLKALLTCFFRIPVDELASYCQLPLSHPISVLFQRWFALAEERRWPMLFQSIIQETGILFANIAVTDDKADKETAKKNSWSADYFLQRIQQILQNLEIEAIERQWDSNELLFFLHQAREPESAFDQDDVPVVETEKPTVKMLNIHTAKGLEFPIVFLAGGFSGTNERRNSFSRYHRDQSTVYDFTGSHKDKQRDEEDQEERRLYYVALTRASHTLYIPQPVTKKAPQSGPLFTFLSQGIRETWHNEDIKIVSYDEHLGKEDTCFLPEISSELIQRERSIMADNSASSQSCPSEATSHNPAVVFPSPKKSFSFRKTRISSFSSLHHYLIDADVSEKPGFYLGREEDWEHQSAIDLVGTREDDQQVTLDQEETRLPAGRIIGNLCHEILQYIDYQGMYQLKTDKEMCESDHYSFIREKIRASYDVQRSFPEFANQYGKLLAEMIFKTLKTPLLFHGNHLPLCDPRLERIHEVPFYYMLSDNKKKRAKHYMHGFIDLICRFEDTFYIVDWKSNLLASYDRRSIEKSMDQEGYHWQYRIYTLALRRWLTNIFGDKTMFSQQFGGIFYAYLRGLNGVDDTTGIFFHHLSSSHLEEYEKKFSSL